LDVRAVDQLREPLGPAQGGLDDDEGRERAVGLAAHGVQGEAGVELGARGRGERRAGRGGGDGGGFDAFRKLPHEEEGVANVFVGGAAVERDLGGEKRGGSAGARGAPHQNPSPLHSSL
jgi:hypothetical protein